LRRASLLPRALRSIKFSKRKTEPRFLWKNPSRSPTADGDDLLGLLVAANLLRSELAGNLVTYVVNRNINFTNICFVGCKFCAFSRGPRESDTYFLDPEQVAQKAVEAAALGATEVCIQGGLPHGLPPFYYRDILARREARRPGHAYSCFLAHGNHYGVELTGMPLCRLSCHAAR
jgi:2-iminoacetate synthase ThiH